VLHAYPLAYDTKKNPFDLKDMCFEIVEEGNTSQSISGTGLFKVRQIDIPMDCWWRPTQGSDPAVQPTLMRFGSDYDVYCKETDPVIRQSMEETHQRSPFRGEGSRDRSQHRRDSSRTSRGSERSRGVSESDQGGPSGGGSGSGGAAGPNNVDQFGVDIEFSNPEPHPTQHPTVEVNAR
jgi:hypothetical protein